MSEKYVKEIDKQNLDVYGKSEEEVRERLKKYLIEVYNFSPEKAEDWARRSEITKAGKKEDK